MLKGQQYSRLDGTKICPECGILEGLDAAGWSQEEKEELERRRRKEERVMLERHAEATLPAWKRFQSRYSGD